MWKDTVKNHQILLFCAVSASFVVFFILGTSSHTEAFVGSTTQASTARPSTLNARKPANDPSNFGSYHVGAREANAFNPTVGTRGDSGSPGPTLLAQLPTMVLPGLALVVVFALLRLFRGPLLRLLGGVPMDNDAIYRSPYGAFGQNDPFKPPMFGAAGAGADVEANLQALMQDATPEEAEMLRNLAERQKSRQFGTTAARPAQWVSPEPIPASPVDALTPEERRERARQRARGQAQAQVDTDLRNSTQAWTERQVQAENTTTAQAQAQSQQMPSSFNQLEEDQKVVAVASVVLTAFVVAEADARGYQTR